MLRVIYRSCCSACFELEGDGPFRALRPYTVLVNGEERFRGEENVFSLFGLRPGTRYAVSVRFDKEQEEEPEEEAPEDLEEEDLEEEDLEEDPETPEEDPEDLDEEDLEEEEDEEEEFEFPEGWVPVLKLLELNYGNKKEEEEEEPEPEPEEEEEEPEPEEEEEIVETAELVTLSESCRVNVRDFGAAGDGAGDDTAAIQSAISCLPEGGRLWFPPGTYRTLPLSLKSNVTLELDEGAVILASPERERWPVIPAYTEDAGKRVLQTGYDGRELNSFQALIHASHVDNVSIVGRGRIDGNGGSGEADWKGLSAAPPRVIFLNHARRVTVHGVTVSSGPAWQIHPFHSRDVSLLDCRVETNATDAPGADGIVPESCDGVVIAGCRIRAGGECVAVRSGRPEMAGRYRAPARNYEIRNCLMEGGRGAVTLGSGLSAGAENIRVRNCLFSGMDRGFTARTRRGWGRGIGVTGFVMENCRMERVGTPLSINMWYSQDPFRRDEYACCREALRVSEKTPRFGTFSFREIECYGAETAACFVDGLPESPVEKVTLERFRVTFAEDPRPGPPAEQNFAKKRCRLGLYFRNVETALFYLTGLFQVEGVPWFEEGCGVVSGDLFAEKHGKL